ncbi:MAG: response regulator transcription factor [Candidatus Omnitrophica bacterium]|nr:response regulator transcription factor [Candidatus Omnitrophota bacterium]
MEKILVVDDETSIREAVTYGLKTAGFNVLTAADGDDGLGMCQRELPDLVVLDLMLPKMDGLEVCRSIKRDTRTAHIPVIMLTVKSDETDKVVGLELGADDYMTKPFSPRELVARIKAVLRRYRDQGDEEIFSLGELKADWARHLVTVKGKGIELTSKEFELLKALAQAGGKVLSRDVLLSRVWGYERSLDIESRTVDLHVSQLRRKLGAAGKRILTIKNVGYRFLIDR